MRSPNTGPNLLQNWKIIKNNKNGGIKIGKFLKSTKMSSPTGPSGAASSPPIGNSFMYIETSSNNHGRSRIQFLLEDISWSTQYAIAKNSQYSSGETDWTLLNLDFTVESYGRSLCFD